MDNSINYRLTLKDLFSSKLKSASESVKGLDGQMNKLNSSAGKLKNLFLGTMIGGAVLSFGKSVIDSLKNYETFSASLRTLMYGDRLTAKALESQLVSLATRTPFSLVDVQEGTKQLLAYGFEAGKVVKNMEMLGDISSGVGAPLTDIVYLYGTLKTQGRAYTKDIMQFTSRGIPIIGQLAKQFGVTEGKVKDLVEAGKVGFPQIEKAFKSMTSEGGQFFGMMAEQTKTVGGQISMLGDNWEQLKVSIGQSQSGIIASTVTFLNDMTGALQKYFSDANQMTENFAKNGAKQFGFWQKAWHETLGILTGYNYGLSSIVKQENFQRNMKLYDHPKNLQDAYANKANLYKHSLGVDEQYKKGEIDRATADRFQATIKGALDKIEGSIKLFKDPKINLASIAKDGLKATGGSSTIGAATEVSGSRPQNVIINLDRLGDVTINGTTMAEDAKQVKDIWSKELLEVLNDANLIAHR